MSFLHLTVPMVLILLVMPNSTITSHGPTLSAEQELFMGGLCLFSYALFLVMQTTRHKELFSHPVDESSEGVLVPQPKHIASNNRRFAIATAAFGLIFSIVPIVLLAEYLGDVINHSIEALHAPVQLAGVIIALLVLLPEGVGACSAASSNNMQRAVNICFGSALATIALTVPCILIVAGLNDFDLTLGVFGGASTLLYATLFTTLITVSSARTTLLQGNVHLMLFISYLFFIFYP